VAAWWAYFDVSEEVSANALRDAQEDAEQEEADSGADDDEVAKVDQRHDLFVYGHLPVTAGLLAAGVGLEELIIHPHDVLPSAGSWLVVGGLATFLAGTALVLGGTERRVGRAVRWPGVAVPVMLGLGFVGPRDPLLFGLATAVLLAIVVAVGTVLSRRQEV
jgi:low temperature requirement protein LtrA